MPGMHMVENEKNNTQCAHSAPQLWGGKFGTAIPTTFKWFAGLSQNQTPCQFLNNAISQNCFVSYDFNVVLCC
jgi:hypothetical protein